MRRSVRRLLPYGLEAFTSPRTRDARRWLAERRRRLRGEPHRILYFHQVDDPYSHLAAQVLAPLVQRYDVVLDAHLVGAPPDDAAPERERLTSFALRDAADVAPGYGLTFPRLAAPPAAPDVLLASRLLAGAIASGAFVAAAPRVGRALWEGGRTQLEALACEWPPAEADATREALAAGSALRRKRGHYLGAMFHHAGEWSWGVDRLWHLERHLRSVGARRAGSPEAPIAPRPDPARSGSALPASPRPLTLEFFASLRSPYTYIAMERVFALPARLPVEVVLRPVLPMVMRGLPVPRAKQLYIVLDTRREADDAGVRFGRLCDPVGRPVERVCSLFAWAREHGRAQELLLSFARGAFAEGLDTAEDEGLRRVVERAGLDWSEGCEQMDREGWRKELEENRQALLGLGLWGVPSFRLRGGADEADYCTWGQDRLWRIEQEIRRRLAAPVPH